MNARVVFFSIVVMALVTYIPRVLPVTLFRREIKSKFIKDFLSYIPFTVLGSITFPSIFYATGDVKSSVIGTVVAVGLACWRGSLLLVASGTIAVVYLLELFVR